MLKSTAKIFFSASSSILLFLAIVLSLFFSNSEIASADCPCQCADWQCTEYQSPVSPYGVTQTCTCATCEGVVCTADPSTYVCNRPGGVCDIEVPPVGDEDGDGIPDSPPPTGSCTVTLSPASPFIYVDGDPYAMTATVTVLSGAVYGVVFESANTSVATVNLAPDLVSPYTRQFTPVSEGTSLVTAYVAMTDGSVRCQDSQTLTVASPRAWWQVRDSDIQTNSSLQSFVPLTQFFGLPGNGGWPGVPAYGGTANFSSGSVSQIGWIANSISTSQRVYNYLYFDNQIPDDIRALIKPVTSQADLTGAVPDENGYEWYKFTGTGLLDMDISSVLALGSRRVILLVDTADLNINANISLTTGFFLAIANQDINIDPAVTALEGLYVADGTVSTGTLGPDGSGTGQDVPLSVRGSVAAYTGINLQRDLADNSAIPAEFFEYAPDQILLFPSTLGVRRINWKEVAP